LNLATAENLRGNPMEAVKYYEHTLQVL